MLPTLWGRIQTRVLVLGILGGLWTIVLVPFLWLISSGDPSILDVYRVAFTVLVTVIVLGVLWEFLYHFLQQFRWERTGRRSSGSSRRSTRASWCGS